MTLPKDLPDLIKVSADEAQRLLQASVREVADLPRRSSPEVVWVGGGSELLVHTGGIGLECAPGQVTVTVPVSCDQLREPARVQVPFAVGTLEAPGGLLMSTLARPAGPGLVVEVWSGALVAFAWEALLHLAELLCAERGGGRTTVPGFVAADNGVLFVQPVGRG